MDTPRVDAAPDVADASAPDAGPRPFVCNSVDDTRDPRMIAMAADLYGDGTLSLAALMTMFTTPGVSVAYRDVDGVVHTAVFGSSNAAPYDPERGAAQRDDDLSSGLGEQARRRPRLPPERPRRADARHQPPDRARAARAPPLRRHPHDAPLAHGRHLPPRLHRLPPRAVAPHHRPDRARRGARQHRRHHLRADRRVAVLGRRPPRLAGARARVVAAAPRLRARPAPPPPRRPSGRTTRTRSPRPSTTRPAATTRRGSPASAGSTSPSTPPRGSGPPPATSPASAATWPRAAPTRSRGSSRATSPSRATPSVRASGCATAPANGVNEDAGHFYEHSGLNYGYCTQFAFFSDGRALATMDNACRGAAFLAARSLCRVLGWPCAGTDMGVR